MSLKLDGTGKITGIDQGLNVVGVGTFSTDLSAGGNVVISGDVVVGGGLTVTGVLTYEDVTNVDSIGIITARSGIIGDLTGNVTGNVTGDITGNIIGSPTLSGISSSISDTAVDIFIYDTSKDSDGGAWRKRTQHTSWYNETLNTATRGSRKEFPAVAVIVAETGKVTIYDGDDPDLPMWMVFETGSTNAPNGNMISAANAGCDNTAISALNGILCVTIGVVQQGGLHTIKFISEENRFYREAASSFTASLYKGNIAERNDAKGHSGDDDTLAIVYQIVNDVAMTVLPNAPIDETTGLPIPTIAVGTNAGTSIIKDDGTVVDIGVRDATTVDFVDDHNIIIGLDYYGNGYLGPIPSADVSDSNYRTDYIWFQPNGGGDIAHLGPGNSGSEVYVNQKALYSDEGLSFYDADLVGFTANSSMVAYATTSYNTGWMHGDIKGAFLSDTDATNVTATDLTTNGSFTTDSDWTKGEQWTISGGSASITDSPNRTTDSLLTQSISGLQAGKSYIVTVTWSTSVGDFDLTLGGTATRIYSIASTYGASGTRTFNITAASSDTLFGIVANQHLVGSFDSISLKLAEEDRSVNNKGLEVFGTIDKDPVAGSGLTAAELVAYGGFNGSNYLRQPHNADLNVGTGDFYIMCWVKGNQLMLWHRNDSGSLDMRCEFPASGGSANKPRFMMSNGGVSIDFFATTAFDTTTWHHCVWVKRGARNGELYIDGVLNNSDTAGSDLNLNGTNSTFSIGNRADSPIEAFNGYVSLFRFGGSAPSAAQVKKMYEDEKFLFQENAACTLYGSSDAVTALAYDEVTEQLHVGTSSGRSDFQGLRRINNTTTAVTTAISAHDEFIAEQ